jgi:hypothetical protein
MEDWRIAQAEAYTERDPELRPRLAAVLAAEAERPLLSGCDERVYDALEQAGVDRQEAIMTIARRGGQCWDRLPEGCNITGRSLHQTLELKSPDGSLIDIDEGIAPLVELCWRLGIETSGSCQGDDVRQRAWLHFPSLDDGARFLTSVDAADAREEMFSTVLEAMTPGPLSPLSVEDRFWFYTAPHYGPILIGVSFDPLEIGPFTDLLLALSRPQLQAEIER